MRKKKYLKNSFYSVINYILLVVLSLIVRKALISYFPLEYIGYEALFTDIFTLLSIADLGMESIITYKLYECLAEDNNGISEIMLFAKRMYTYIATGVLIVGGIIFLFLPFLFEMQVYDMPLITGVYFIQVINLTFSYLTGYKRLLLIADQKEYICLLWDSFILVIIQISRIFILGYFKNYYLYMGVCILQTLGQNLGINFRCNKEYKDILNITQKVKIKFQDFGHDVGNFLCHKVSAVVYAATDNIVITATMGLAMAALYSNYYMLARYTYSFATKIMKPLQASIGNYLYSDIEKEQKYLLLSRLNEMAFIFASFVCNSLIQLSTPFIRIWLGSEYVQEQRLVILLALNIFIAINQDVIFYFRNSFGKYEYDKKYMIMSAFSNLFLSILFGKIWGVSGITMATIIGHLFIWYGRVKFVYSEFLQIGIKKYWIRQAQLIVILFLQLTITEWMTKGVCYGIKGCLYKELCVCLVSIAGILILYSVRGKKN